MNEMWRYEKAGRMRMERSACEVQPHRQQMTHILSCICTSSNLLNPYQSVYCKHHSTETPLLYIHNHLINTIRSQEVSCVCSGFQPPQSVRCFSHNLHNNPTKVFHVTYFQSRLKISTTTQLDYSVAWILHVLAPSHLFPP